MDWRDYLPTTGGERGPYTGAFSRAAEVHAVGIGFLVYLAAPDLLPAIVAYGLGSGTGKAKRSGQFREAARELAYTALGVALAMGATALGVA